MAARNDWTLPRGLARHPSRADADSLGMNVDEPVAINSIPASSSAAVAF